jgi:hypothetical protein
VVEKPVAVAVAELNGDPFDDVITASFMGIVTVRLGGPDGALGAPNTQDILGVRTTRIATADVNNDGKVDIVAGRGGAGVNENFTVVLGQGDGTFSEPIFTKSGTDPWAVVVGNFVGDANLDVATASRVADTVSIHAGNGDGTFGAPATYDVGEYPTSLAAADVNYDGLTDFVTANADTDDVSVLVNNGLGGYTHNRYSVGPRPFAMAVGDLDFDGMPDIAVADEIAADVSVLLNDGSGAFGSRTSYPIGDWAADVLIADFNADGLNDIASVSPDVDRASVLKNNGSGLFSSPFHFAVGDNPRGLAVGDVDADGRRDVVAANRDSTDVSVLRNTRPPTIQPIPADMDAGSHVVGTSTRRTIMLTNLNWFPVTVNSLKISGPNAADFRIASQTCTAAKVAPSGQCQISVDFTAAASGPRMAWLDISLEGRVEPVQVELRGSGVLPSAGGGSDSGAGTPTTEPARPRLAAPTVKGPTKARRNRAVAFTIRVPNAGDGPATDVTVRAKGRGLSATHRVGTIPAGGSQAVKVKLRPRKAGKIKVIFTVASVDGGTVTVIRTLRVRR